ncbi:MULTISPECIES: hypothetical protein [Photorhabdus]|nr:hypothetical protein [Photorhabdus asymbiotica]
MTGVSECSQQSSSLKDEGYRSGRDYGCNKKCSFNPCGRVCST